MGDGRLVRSSPHLRAMGGGRGTGMLSRSGSLRMCLCSMGGRCGRISRTIPFSGRRLFVPAGAGVSVYGLLVLGSGGWIIFCGFNFGLLF